MLSDLSGFLISLVALRLSRREATRRYSYGYHQVEVLGAMLSVFLLVERFDIEPFPDFFIQMSKLYRGRSLLYRRQILEVNICWKALDEIYKIYMLLHRSDLNISENFRQTSSHFLAKF